MQDGGGGGESNYREKESDNRVGFRLGYEMFEDGK